MGQSAKRQAVIQPAQYPVCVKRLIGRKFKDDVVQKDIKMVLTRSSRPTMAMPGYRCGAKNGTAADLGRLRKMKTAGGISRRARVTEAVITVPAYFNDSQRQATRTPAKSPG